MNHQTQQQTRACFRTVQAPCTFAGMLIGTDGHAIQKHAVLPAGMKAFGIAAGTPLSPTARERLEELSLAFFASGLNPAQQAELTAITQAVQQVQQ